MGNTEASLLAQVWCCECFGVTQRGLVPGGGREPEARVFPGIGGPDCEWDSGPLDASGPTFPTYTVSWGLGPSLRRACLPPPILLRCFCKLEVNIPWTAPLGYIQDWCGFWGPQVVCPGWGLVAVAADPAQPERRYAQMTAFAVCEKKVKKETGSA